MPGEVYRAEPGLAEARELAATVEQYRSRTGRAYPTWCEILGLLRELGYRKPDSHGRAIEESPAAEGRC